MPCTPEPTDMPIAVGDIVSCSISPITDTDLFRFDGTAGETVVLALTDRTGGSPRPVAELFDPNAVAIDTLSIGDTGDARQMTLTETGLYTVLVREAGDDQSVSYHLALQRLFPPPAEAVPLVQRLPDPGWDRRRRRYRRRGLRG